MHESIKAIRYEINDVTIQTHSQWYIICESIVTMSDRIEIMIFLIWFTVILILFVILLVYCKTSVFAENDRYLMYTIYRSVGWHSNVNALSQRLIPMKWFAH